MRAPLYLPVLAALLLMGANPARGRWQLFSATAYSVEGETSSGTITREGRTVAADPRVLPAGTRIEIQDAGAYSGVYVVQDTGPAIRGREIDIFIDDPAEAKKFGRRRVRLRVITPAVPKEGKNVRR